MKIKKKLFALLAVLVVAAAMFAVWHITAPSASAGNKTIALAVIHADGSEKDFAFTTKAENLRAALEEQDLISGDTSEYGLFVTTVDGEFADVNKTEWWCLTKEGVTSETGVDDTLIADGDQYEFTFTVGW